MGNIALNRPVTASKTIIPYTASRAVDGNLSPSNRWLTDQIPATLMVDPQAKYLVNRWVVKHPAVINTPNTAWNYQNYANSDYKLQGSNDNFNWFDIDVVTNNSATLTDRTFVSVAFRYYRVYVSKGLRCNNQTTSILEFELYQAYSAVLTNLAISAGTLSPAFNQATLNYTATVNPDVATINVTPTALSPMAIIKVNNVQVVSGYATPVSLGFGSNTITVNVNDGGVQQNYVIAVTRLSNNLSSLTAQTGSTNIPLAPSFDKNTVAYTASVGNEVTSMTVTPTAETAGVSITVNGTAVQSGQPSQSIDLSVGTNTINIVVTANGQPKTYTVVVTRAGSAYLSSLTAQSRSGAIALSPSFVKTTANYTASVANNISSVTFTPTAESASATITINGTSVVSGQPSSSFTLNEGNNTYSIVVSSGGISFTYTVVITRAYNLLLNQVVIAYTGRASGSQTITTNATDLSYTVGIASGATSMTVAPYAASSNTVVKVNGNVVVSGTPSGPITPLTSSNVVTITVSTPDNSQTRTYTITVTK